MPWGRLQLWDGWRNPSPATAPDLHPAAVVDVELASYFTGA